MYKITYLAEEEGTMDMFDLTTIANSLLKGLLQLRNFALSQNFPTLRSNHCVVIFCFLLWYGAQCQLFNEEYLRVTKLEATLPFNITYLTSWPPSQLLFSLMLVSCVHYKLTRVNNVPMDVWPRHHPKGCYTNRPFYRVHDDLSQSRFLEDIGFFCGDENTYWVRPEL